MLALEQLREVNCILQRNARALLDKAFSVSHPERLGTRGFKGPGGAIANQPMGAICLECRRDLDTGL